MADSESSDVLANLPAGRPTRRSSRRGAPAVEGGAATTTPASAKPAAATTKRAPAKPRAAAKPKTAAAAAKPKAAAPAKPKAAAKPKPTTAAAKTAAAKTTAAKTAPAKTTAAKSTTAAKTTAATKAKATTAKATPAAKKPTAAKATPAAKKPAAAKAAPAAKPAPTQPSTGRRPRIATPPEGRRADFSGSAAGTHRARKVTTNRPWLPSSGFALPESKERPPIGIALEGLAAALGDVARLSIGIAQSLTVKRRSDDALEPAETDERSPSKL